MIKIDKLNTHLASFTNEGLYTVSSKSLASIEHFTHPESLLVNLVSQFITFPVRNPSMIVSNYVGTNVTDFNHQSNASKEKVLLFFEEFLSIEKIDEKYFSDFFGYNALPKRRRLKDAIAAKALTGITYITKEQEEEVLSLYKHMAFLIINEALFSKNERFYVELYQAAGKAISIGTKDLYWGNPDLFSFLKESAIDLKPYSSEIKQTLQETFSLLSENPLKGDIYRVNQLEELMYLFDKSNKETFFIFYENFFNEKIEAFILNNNPTTDELNEMLFLKSEIKEFIDLKSKY